MLFCLVMWFRKLYLFFSDFCCDFLARSCGFCFARHGDVEHFLDSQDMWKGTAFTTKKMNNTRKENNKNNSNKQQKWNKHNTKTITTTRAKRNQQQQHHPITKSLPLLSPWSRTKRNEWQSRGGEEQRPPPLHPPASEPCHETRTLNAIRSLNKLSENQRMSQKYEGNEKKKWKDVKFKVYVYIRINTFTN